MSLRDLDSRLRELAKTGQSVSGKMDSPPYLTKAVFGRAHFFPFVPLPYLRRVCQYWQLLHLDFIPLDGRRRLIVGVHEAHMELIGLLTYSDLPPSLPPRWLVDPFSVLTRMISRGMDKNGGTLRPSGVLDLVGQVYFDVALSNLGSDTSGSRRHLVDFSCGDTGALVVASEQSLLHSEADAIASHPLPGFPFEPRPRLLTVSARVDTPLDLEGVHWEPNRPAQPPVFSLWRGFVSLWHLSPILFACVL